MFQHYFVVAVDVRPRLQGSVLVGPQREVYYIKRYMRLDGHIAYELVVFLVLMSAQILASAISLGFQSHRDADAVKEPFVGLVEHIVC